VARNENRGVDDTRSDSGTDGPAEIAKSDTTKPTKSGPIEKVVDPLEKPSSDEKGGDNTENKTDTKTDAKTDTKADAKTENKTDTKTDTKDEKVPSPTPEKPRVAAERPATAKKGCQPQGQVNPFDQRPVCGERKPTKTNKRETAKEDLIALKISSKPAWAKAEIDGWGQCDTSCTLHLPPGTYTV